MTTLEADLAKAKAENVEVTEETLVADLTDGRTIVVPIVWFPRLSHSSVEERRDFRLTGNGEGIHWPRLDEDISIRSLLAGRRSDESPESLQAWLSKRKPKAT